MFDEIDLNDLKKEYDLKLEVKENKLFCEEFNGTYLEIEDLCENICYWIQDKYDYFTDYSILDSGYIFTIEIF